MKTVFLASFVSCLLFMLSACVSTAPAPSKTVTEQMPKDQTDGNIGCIVSSNEACAAASTLSKVL